MRNKLAVVWGLLAVVVGCGEPSLGAIGSPDGVGMELDPVPMSATSGAGVPSLSPFEPASMPAPDAAEVPVAPAPPGPPLRPYTDVRLDGEAAGVARARHAIDTRTAVVKELFDTAGATFPAKELVLRVFKDDSTFEVWATGAESAELVHVTTYGVCAMSGVLGPKRREGDLQVPEGFYKIQYLWPDSAFYLSMKVGYPNASDRILSDPRAPGSDIMIHGGCASIGCIAISDERIEELWTIVSATNNLGKVELQIYPTRDFDKLAQHPDYPRHAAFWADLEAGHRAFEETHRPLAMSVAWDGRYQLAAQR